MSTSVVRRMNFVVKAEVIEFVDMLPNLMLSPRSKCMLGNDSIVYRA
jgi:hypothetical protein